MQSELPSYWDESGADSPNSNSGINSLLNDDILNASISFQGTYKSNSTIGIKFQYLNHAITPLVIDSISVNAINYAFQRMATSDWGGNIFFSTNTLNKPFFPTKGLEANITFDYLFSREFNLHMISNSVGEVKETLDLSHHIRSSVNLKWVVPIFKKLSFITQFEMQMGNGSDGLEWFPYETFIGGNRPIGWFVHAYEGTPSKRFSVLNFSAINIGLQYEPINNLFLSAKVDYLESEYPMKWIDNEIFTENIGAHPRRLGFSGKLSYSSIIGPIEVGIGKDQYLKGVHGFFGFGYYIKR